MIASMPTPFMHLRAAHRFLGDSDVPETLRQSLTTHLGAFLLGNVAPDARVSGGVARTNTHFFDYTPPKIEPKAIDTLLAQHPALQKSQGGQQAFVAGYLAHLAMDVVWAEEMLFPYFYFKDWGTQGSRFIMLHVLLCYLDERDFRQWGENFAEALAATQPDHWLPFLGDEDLRVWRDIIARQICAECASETLAILGSRVTVGAEGLREMLADPLKLQLALWDHVPREAVFEVEKTMYRAMVTDMIRFMGDST